MCMFFWGGPGFDPGFDLGVTAGDMEGVELEGGGLLAWGWREGPGGV